MEVERHVDIRQCGIVVRHQMCSWVQYTVNKHQVHSIDIEERFTVHRPVAATILYAPTHIYCFPFFAYFVVGSTSVRLLCLRNS